MYASSVAQETEALLEYTNYKSRWVYSAKWPKMQSI